MVETIAEPPRTPGMVIFAAILNFASAAAWFAGVLFSVLFLFLGNAVEIYQKFLEELKRIYLDVSSRVSWTANQPVTDADYTALFNFFFVVLALFCLFFVVYHMITGVGLLRARKTAWFLQLLSAVIGIAFIPYGTVISVVILVTFFQRSVRDFFKV
ncbi:MAG: hypothetical protein ACREH5_05675 [Candidatus Omnitrophota bacterium]